MGFSLSKSLGVRGSVGNFLDNPASLLNPVGGLLTEMGIPTILGGKKAGGKGSDGGIDASGRPIGVGYQSQLDSPAYRKMQSQYNSGSASPWANIATARQGDVAEKSKQDLASRTAGQTAQSMDKLAATGGLTSGARERTVQGGQQNLMSGTQDIGNAYGQNLMNIGLEDAQANQQIGKGLMSAEMSDLSGRNAYNQNKYQADMQAWAARQQAQATRDAGKKDGLLGLGIAGL